MADFKLSSCGYRIAIEILGDQYTGPLYSATAQKRSSFGSRERLLHEINDELAASLDEARRVIVNKTAAEDVVEQPSNGRALA